MRPAAFPPRRPSGLLRYLIPVIIIISCFYYLRQPPVDIPASNPSLQGSKIYPLPSTGSLKVDEAVEKQQPLDDDSSLSSPHSGSKSSSPSSSSASHIFDVPPSSAGQHPIDHLIKVAERDYDDLIAKESHTLTEAAEAYRKRRGRHPPPGFDKWYEFAKDLDALVIEDFWDQIYHDLAPYWAVPAEQIRREAWDFEMTINIRNGSATAGSDWFWTQIWLKLIQTLEHLLPDMDLALNAMDEPRLVVPWEEIDELMQMADKTKRMPRPDEVTSVWASLPAPGEGPDENVKVRAKNWENTRT